MSKSASEQNRKDLEKWYLASGYEDIKFWVPPNLIASQEECEAEVLAAVKAFDPKRKAANGKTL